MSHAKLILASQSPRRQQLLRDAGYDFEVVIPEETAECGVCSRETPPEMVARLALQKARDVANRTEKGLVLSCDTVVDCHGRILGKPRSREHAREMLYWLRGYDHTVYSGVCLWRRPGDQRLVKTAATRLRMDTLPDKHLEDYLESEAWEGKAGAFGYQDRLGWIHVIDGSESNVVGLPLELLADMLHELSQPSAPRHGF